MTDQATVAVTRSHYPFTVLVISLSYTGLHKLRKESFH